VTDYTHGPAIAFDFAAGLPIKNAVGNVYAPTDGSYATPLTVTTMFGVPVTDITSGHAGDYRTIPVDAAARGVEGGRRP
jgi:hypothetical protein